jgi:hypothetical protein
VTESLVALALPEAMARIDAAGEALAGVVVTGPPGAGRGEGVPRVIRERRRPDGIELTVAFPVPPRAGGEES